MSENKKEEKKEEIELNWPPLESDPMIFNNYFHSLGLKSDVFFKEMIALVDYNQFLLINGPLLGVILNFSRGEKKTDKNFQKEENVSYFMKQTSELDEACGLIASLHCFGNAKQGKLGFEPGSVLENFFNEAKKLTPIDRAHLLEKDSKFKKAHIKFAEQGQTNVSEQIKSNFVGHYVCFMNINGKLVLFDGLKDSPSIINDNINDNNFLEQVSLYILSLIENNEIKEQASVMLIADSESQLVDLLEE